MNMKQIISTLTAGLLSAVLLAGCTVFVDGDAVTSMDLVDEEGVTLSSVSDWTPGESRIFHLDELPEGCEVNVVSSDRELMTADYADNAITLTAVESGHAIVTVELSMNGSSLSKSYEIQITARHMQAGMTLIDSGLSSRKMPWKVPSTPSGKTSALPPLPRAIWNCRPAIRPRSCSPALMSPTANPSPWKLR